MRRAIRRLSLLSVLLTAVCAFGQTGHWVSYPNDVSGLGAYICDCGGTTGVYGRDETDTLLFFDTNGGAWSEYVRPAMEVWHYIEAEGDLVLAVADTVAVVYSGRTSTIHELPLEGTLLNIETNVWSFRCGPSLAYVATDQYFYVFDAELGTWLQTPMTVPGDFIRSHSGVGEDWAGITLELTYGAPPPCYAYSGTAHAFAYTDNGPLYGPRYQGALDHGFAEYNNVSGALDMVGYSAVTNAFSRVSIGTNFGQLQYGASDNTGKALRTVFAAVWQTSGEYQQHYACYDTRRGTWTHEIYDWNNAEYSYYHNLDVGGQYAATWVRNRDTDQMGYRIYSGLDGSITMYWPGITDGADQCIPGGTVYVAVKRGVRAWGFDVATGNSATLELPATDYLGLRTEGESFVQFSVWNSGDATIDLHAYHGPTDTWQTTSTGYTAYLDLQSGAHCMVHIWADPGTQATFYSGHLGVYNSAIMVDSANTNWWRSDNLAAIANQSGECVFYDARRDQVTVRNMDWDAEGIGSDTFVAVDPVTQTGWGYSGVTGHWASVDIGETPRTGKAGAHVGWVATPWRSQTYWAFNAHHDEWVPLDAGSGGRGEAVGDEIMLVWHLGQVFAFDPEAPIVSIEDPEEDDVPPAIVPHEVALHPARPNPFNPETTVAFDLPRDGQVRLSAFDVRGRRVRELATGAWTAGTHEVRWDGRDDAGRTLPSGTYLLRLETERRVVGRRVMLVK